MWKIKKKFLSSIAIKSFIWFKKMYTEKCKPKISKKHFNLPSLPPATTPANLSSLYTFFFFKTRKKIIQICKLRVNI